MSYSFPTDRLQTPSKSISVRKSLVLVSFGAFNPPTIMHLRMFEEAKDYLRDNRGIQVIGGIISPSSDSYQKPGNVSSAHRGAMVKLALEDSDWIGMDRWEMEQPRFVRSRVVLTHVEEELRLHFGEDQLSKIQVSLLCGADTLQSFTQEEIWAPEDVEYILRNHGVVCLERGDESDIFRTIFKHDLLHRYAHMITVVPSLISVDISATMMRLYAKRGYSTKYLLNEGVRAYIAEHGLYQEEPVEIFSPTTIFREDIDWDQFFKKYPQAEAHSPRIQGLDADEWGEMPKKPKEAEEAGEE